jgi:hypothetical protein
MKTEDLIEIIEQESKACRETAGKSADYGNAFWACGTMLHSLANRLREKLESDPK